MSLGYSGAEKMPGLSHEEAKRLDASGLYGLTGEDLDDFLADSDVSAQESTEQPEITQEA